MYSTTATPTIMNLTESRIQDLNDTMEDRGGDVLWENIFFVKRHPYVQKAQLSIAIYGLFETIFYFVLTYNVLKTILEKHYFLRSKQKIIVCLKGQSDSEIKESLSVH